MTRRFVCVGLALAVAAGLGLAPVEAKGRCRAILAGSYTCERTGTDGIARDFVLLDRQCRAEGRVCSQDGSECTTLFRDVVCQRTDGGTGEVRVGAGCFCGGGSVGVGTDREDPISAEEFLRIQEALESGDADGATCEAPAPLRPVAAE